jgi:DNA-binding GntR family transcriptional regulator
MSTIQETVHAELFKAIICGRIPPGEKIVIDKIAMQMRVSRIPVREALHRLQEAGLISIDKWKGAIINKLSVENLKEITRIRLMLESQAAQRAAENCSPQLSKELEIIHEQWKRSIPLMKKNDLKTVEEYLRLNRQFHHTIYRGALMPILHQIINSLWDRVSPYLHILVAGEIEGAVTSETVQIHEGMLNGMKNRSAAEVSRWLREDLIRAEESILKFFNK